VASIGRICPGSPCSPARITHVAYPRPAPVGKPGARERGEKLARAEALGKKVCQNSR